MTLMLPTKYISRLGISVNFLPKFEKLKDLSGPIFIFSFFKILEDDRVKIFSGLVFYSNIL